MLIDTKESNKPRLFVDMDGVLAEWKNMTIPSQIPLERINKFIKDTLYNEGYYFNLKPYKRIVEAIKDIIKEGKVDVYITSCVLPEDKDYPDAHPERDKNRWLDKVFGGLIMPQNRIFVPDGEPKRNHIPFELKDGDLLLDDYTKNLNDWVSEKSCKLKGIKVLNGINDTHESWKGERVAILSDPDVIKETIYDEMGIYMAKDKDNTIEVKINGEKVKIDLCEAQIIKNKYNFQLTVEYLQENYDLSPRKCEKMAGVLRSWMDFNAPMESEFIKEVAEELGIELKPLDEELER